MQIINQVSKYAAIEMCISNVHHLGPAYINSHPAQKQNDEQKVNAKYAWNF